MERKLLSMLGLATKAGQMKSGEFSTEKAVKDGKAYLVIVANDASNNTKKKFQNMCDYYQIPCYFFAEKSQLGHAIGKEFRASVACTGEQFAKTMIQQLERLK